MLAAPLIVGIVLGGPSLRHVLLVPAWVAAYLFYQTFTNWYRAAAGQRRRYRTPMIVYAAIATALGVPLLMVTPRLLWWSPVFVVLSAVTLGCIVRKAVRSLLNDLATQAAACLVAVVAVDAATAPHVSLAVAWIAAGCLYAYFAGTSFYVKTMIRERGRGGWYAASVIYHSVVLAGMAALGFVFARPAAAWFATCVAVLLLARAVVVPRRWPKAKPLAIGVGEIVLTVLVIAATLAVCGL